MNCRDFRRCTLEPYKYLKYLFENLPKAKVLADYESLLPWNVKI